MSIPLTLRNAKGLPLTHAELDANLAELRDAAALALRGAVASPSVQLTGAPRLIAGVAATFSGATVRSVWACLTPVGANPGPARVAVTVADSWTQSLTPNVPGPHRYQLWSAQTGGELLWESADMEVFPAGSVPPTISPGQVFSVLEGLPVGTLVGTVQAEGAATGFALAAGTPFQISAAGVVTAAAVLDHEATARHTLTITASNSWGSATGTVVVDVENVPEAPVLAPANLTMRPGAPIGTILGGIPSAGGDRPTEWTAGGLPAFLSLDPIGRIVVVGDTSGLAVGDVRNFSVAGTVPGAGFATSAVTVTVSDAGMDVVTTVAFEGIGAPAGAVPAFYAQPFAIGDVPAGQSLALRRSGTAALLPTQVEVLGRHEDGSMRHALIATPLGAVADLARESYELVRTTTPPALGPALSFAGRTAVLTIGSPGAAAHTVDLIAQIGAARRRAGPFATEARVWVEVPPAALGGRTNIQVVADLTICSDGVLHTRVQVRNIITGYGFTPAGSGPVAYALRLVQDGATVLDYPAVDHQPRRILTRRRSTRPDGTAVASPPRPAHSLDMCRRAGIAFHFDDHGVPSHFNSHARNGTPATFPGRLQTIGLTSPAWDTPFGNRGLRAHDLGRGMGAGGDGFVLGVTTEAQASLLAQYHRDTFDYVIGQAEVSGIVFWHFWLRSSRYDEDGRGSWVNLADAPAAAHVNMKGGEANLFPIAGQSPFDPMNSHHPPLSFVAYALTGEAGLLDLLIGASSWSMVEFNHLAQRQLRVDLETGEGTNIMLGPQLRQTAWIVRQLTQALWSLPDASPIRSYFRAVWDAQTAILDERMPVWRNWLSDAAGMKLQHSDEASASLLQTWQQSYFSCVMLLAHRMGYATREHIDFLRGYETSFWLTSGLSTFARGGQHINTGRLGAYLPNWAAIAAASPGAGASGEQRNYSNVFSMLRELYPDDPAAARAWDVAIRTSMFGDNTHYNAPTVFQTHLRHSGVPLGTTRAQTQISAVAANQSLVMVRGTAPGAIVGIVRLTGCVFHDSLAIVGGTGHGLFSIDRAGVVSNIAAGGPNVAPLLTLVVEVLRAGVRTRGVVLVVIRTPAAPTIPVQSLSAPSNAVVGAVLGRVEATGEDVALSMTGGAGRLRLEGRDIVVSMAPVGAPGDSLQIELTATNGGGTATRSIPLTVTAPIALPMIPNPPPVFTTDEDAPTGVEIGHVLSTGTIRQVPSAQELAAEILPDGRVVTATPPRNHGPGGVRLRLFGGREHGLRVIEYDAGNPAGTRRGMFHVNVRSSGNILNAPDIRMQGVFALKRVVHAFARPVLVIRNAVLDARAISFLPSGELDIAAIEAHAAGQEAVVLEWHDQTRRRRPLTWRHLHGAAPPANNRLPPITDAQGRVLRMTTGEPCILVSSQRHLTTHALVLDGVMTIWRTGGTLDLGAYMVAEFAVMPTIFESIVFDSSPSALFMMSWDPRMELRGNRQGEPQIAGPPGLPAIDTPYVLGFDVLGATRVTSVNGELGSPTAAAATPFVAESMLRIGGIMTPTRVAALVMHQGGAGFATGQRGGLVRTLRTLHGFAPPPFVTGVRLDARASAAAGTLIGRVPIDSSLPLTSVAIIGASPFVIDLAGDLRVGGAALPPGEQIVPVTVRATNARGPSADTTLLVQVWQRPVVAGGQTFSIPANAAVGTEFGQVAATGSPTAFNAPGAAFVGITAAGRFRVLAPMTTGASASLNVVASNVAGSSDPVAVSVTVAPPVDAPQIPDEVLFATEDQVDVGTVFGVIPNSGGPVAQWEIVEPVPPPPEIGVTGIGLVRAAAPVADLSTGRIVQIRARGTNALASDEVLVRINLAVPTLIYGVSRPGVVGMPPADSLAAAPWAVYGLRRLRPSYTGPALRARRVSDSMEADFGFDAAGVLDWDGLITWAGGAAVRVRTWYNQGLASQHLHQPVAARQPHLLAAGGAGFHLQGGRRAMRVNATQLGEGLVTNDFVLPAIGRGTPDVAMVAVLQRAGFVNNHRLLSLGNPGAGVVHDAGGVLVVEQGTSVTSQYSIFRGAPNLSTPSPADGVAHTLALSSQPAKQIHVNGTASAVGGLLYSNLLQGLVRTLRIGAHDDVGLLGYNGLFSELTVWGRLRDADRQAVEANMRAWHGF